SNDVASSMTLEEQLQAARRLVAKELEHLERLRQRKERELASFDERRQLLLQAQLMLQPMGAEAGPQASLDAVQNLLQKPQEVRRRTEEDESAYDESRPRRRSGGSDKEKAPQCHMCRQTRRARPRSPPRGPLYS